MSPPNLQRARNHYATQAGIVAAAVQAVRSLFRRGRPLAEVVNVVAAYQLAAATASVQAIASEAGSRTPLVNPRPFAGVSSLGFPVSEPIVATIDYVTPAPVEPLPQSWWDDTQAFMADVERVIAEEVRAAGRSAAGAEIAARPTWQNYVRVLKPPSCKRCVILAGRIYRDNEGFSRHPPTCDCEHWPVQDWEAAHDAGLVSSPSEAFEKGQIRDLTEAEAEAIRDGADITTVINSASGISTADLFGRRVKVTSYGTTRRSAWRKANPSLLVRLRPEAIYSIAGDDRDLLLSLLRTYGYLTS